METPPPPPAEPALPPCWRCGTPPEDRYQEYCLECGVRLARYYPRSSVFRREAWSRESPAWLWLTLLALLLIALIATPIVALAADRDEGDRTRRAAPPGPTTSDITIVTDITTVPVPPPTGTFTQTFPTTTFPTTTAPTTTGITTTTRATTTTDGGGLTTWPAGQSGFTIVIASYRKTSGARDRAEAKANEALGRGLSQVGILDSSDFGSLRSGYWVVFSGVHDTQNEARGRLSSVRASYPAAYVREVTP